MHTINISSDKIFTTDGLTIYTFSNVMLKKYNVFTDSLLVMLDILIIRDVLIPPNPKLFFIITVLCKCDVLLSVVTKLGTLQAIFLFIVENM